MVRILGIETSCDETAIGVVEDGRTIRSNVVASSQQFHQAYGGSCRRSPRGCMSR